MCALLSRHACPETVTGPAAPAVTDCDTTFRLGGACPVGWEPTVIQVALYVTVLLGLVAKKQLPVTVTTSPAFKAL
jgi:hypothetical protein